MTKNEKPGITDRQKMEGIAELIRSILTAEELKLLVHYLTDRAYRKDQRT